ncbi:ribosome hibernation-promoting factor, HPF/YfiA family [Thiofilum flexile]|uniref:ribosome hibernation-promoting factor, HPF/YfiA family n=1 Tax=Thiofilum flexile TaxID=125627 RepID=UPI00037BE66C|nr:ribosome-associated translation inhibitor RaiA [Thiofilum flexile]
MQLEITGHHIEVTPALSRYIHEKATRLKRHFDQLLTIHFTIEVQKLVHKAEATLTVSGSRIYADASSDNMYAALDALADKLDRQIIKHKEKLKDHHTKEGSHRNLALADESQV